MVEHFLNDFDECARIIHERSVLLDTKGTGCHYQLSNAIHTDKVHLFSPVLERSPNRKRFAERLLQRMWEKDIDPRRHIDVLLGTGIAAMPLVYTLQDSGALEHTRAMYMGERDGELVLGPGFSFRQDERIFLVHLAAVSFRTIKRTIHAIHAFADETHIQPCVEGFAVLIDRSPEGFEWKRDFASFKYVVGIRSPIIAYPADAEKCPLCLKAIPLVDLRGTA